MKPFIILWISVFLGARALCVDFSDQQQSVTYPHFDRIGTWIKTIEALYSEAEISWYLDLTEYFLAACEYKESFFICLYPKDPSKAVEFFMGLDHWSIQTLLGDPLVGPQANLTDPQLSQNINHAKSNGDFSITIFYYGTRINLPIERSQIVKVVFQELGFEIHINEESKVVDFIRYK